MRSTRPAMLAAASLLCSAASAQMFPPQTKDQRIQFATAHYKAALAARSGTGPGFCVDWGDRSVVLAVDGPAALAKALARFPEPPPARFVTHSLWTSTATNPTVLAREPITITYSFVPDGVVIPGYNGELATPNILHATFTPVFGSADGWKNHFRRAFNRWGELSGIVYVEVSDDGAPLTPDFPTNAGVLGTRGDVRISAHNIDGVSGILAYNFYPQYGSDMVLDSSDTSFYTDPTNNYRAFHFIATHEHGHGLGFEHVTPVDETKLMEPFINESFDGPQQDDIRAVQRSYGDDSESNDSIAEAASLGTIAVGAPPLIERAIEATGQQDFYSFNLTTPYIIDLELIPDGTTYSTFENGTITAGTIHDLALEVIDGNGNTVLASAAGNPAGATESITGLELYGPATYYLRVYSQGGADDVQRYRLNFGAIPVIPPPPDVATMIFESDAAADGELRESGPGTGVGGSIVNATTAGLVGDTYARAQRKLLLSFDTSPLPDGSPVVAARLRVRGNKLHGDPSAFGPVFADTTVGFFGTSPSLEALDFQAPAMATGSAIGVPPTDGSYHEASLGAAAVATVDRTGTTQIRLGFGVAANPNTLSDAVQISMGEDIASRRPQLAVDYLVFSTFTPTPTPTPTPVPTPTPCSPAVNPPDDAIFLSTADDGEVRESSQFSAVGGFVNATSSVIQLGDTSSKQQRVAILSFDTSSLPDDAIVLGAELNLTATGKSGDPSVLGDLLFDVEAGAFGGDAALAAGDFEAAASAPISGLVTAAAVPQSGYPAPITVPLTGIAPCNVNPAGVTQVRVRFSVPDDGDGNSDVLYLSTAENRTHGPATLTVVYSTP